MKVVVDTNVVAYYVLGTELFFDEALPFWHAVTEPVAPAFWEAELVNVVWMVVRTGVLPLDEGRRRLDLSTALGIQSVPTASLWQGALCRAIESGVAAYDALFVELADREGVPLATFDRKLLTTFPDIAQRPAALCSK